MRAKGEKLTFAEWPLPQSTNGNPGFYKLVSAARMFPPLTNKEIYPGSVAIMDFKSPGEARVAWSYPYLISYNETTNDWTEFSTAMDKASDALQQIREVMQNPEPDLGNYTASTAIGSPAPNNFVAQRIAAQWLMGATLNDLHQRKLAEALTNLHALASFVQFHRNDPTLVNHMIRIAIGGLGLMATWEALQADGWTDEQLAQMQHDWESVDFLEQLRKGMEGERAFGIDMFDHVRSSGIASVVPTTVYPPRPTFGSQIASLAWKNLVGNSDELFYLQNIQQFVESSRTLESSRNWLATKINWEKVHIEMEKKTASPIQRYQYALSVIAIPNLSKAALTATRNETFRQLTLAAIAIKRYQLRYQKLPPTLNAIVSEILSAVPVDCIDGKPLRYRVNNDGTFTLYSINENARDDGGDPTPLQSTNKFDLWSGRDAVWPKAIRN